MKTPFENDRLGHLDELDGRKAMFFVFKLVSHPNQNDIFACFIQEHDMENSAEYNNVFEINIRSFFLGENIS